MEVDKINYYMKKAVNRSYRLAFPALLLTLLLSIPAKAVPLFYTFEGTINSIGDDLGIIGSGPNAFSYDPVSYTLPEPMSAGLMLIGIGGFASLRGKAFCMAPFRHFTKDRPT